MRTIFRYSLSRSRGQILGWGIPFALLAMYLVAFWPTMAGQQEQFIQLFKAYPRELMAFFGHIETMFTPEGFLTIEFFSYMPLILGIYAALAGSGLLASEEENGILDLVLAHPLSRTALLLGRLLAFVVVTVVILAILWLGFVVAMTWSPMDVGWDKMALPFISLLAVVLLFGTLALLLSMLLPSRRLAAMTAGILLVASYFITSLANVDEDLKAFARFSPLNYYQSGKALNGLNLAWLGGLLAFALLFALLAWWRFQRRDIRVGGEGSWRWPSLRRRGAKAGTRA